MVFQESTSPQGGIPTLSESKFSHLANIDAPPTWESGFPIYNHARSVEVPSSLSDPVWATHIPVRREEVKYKPSEAWQPPVQPAIAASQLGPRSTVNTTQSAGVQKLQRKISWGHVSSTSPLGLEPPLIAGTACGRAIPLPASPVHSKANQQPEARNLKRCGERISQKVATCLVALPSLSPVGWGSNKASDDC